MTRSRSARFFLFFFFLWNRRFRRNLFVPRQMCGMSAGGQAGTVQDSSQTSYLTSLLEDRQQQLLPATWSRKKQQVALMVSHSYGAGLGGGGGIVKCI